MWQLLPVKHLVDQPNIIGREAERKSVCPLELRRNIPAERHDTLMHNADKSRTGKES